MDESKSVLYENFETSDRLQIFFKNSAWICTLWEKYDRGLWGRTKIRNLKVNKNCQPISGYDAHLLGARDLLYAH